MPVPGGSNQEQDQPVILFNGNKAAEQEGTEETEEF
jgi:hypothetical protein